ncbi:MAG: DUF2844 domain-containing protein [Oligoflexia bacterium]|nr:DUF2844 domain-containing protein [Oligoflexia bacterium]
MPSSPLFKIRLQGYVLAWIALSLFSSGSALGALGEREDSIEVDRKSLSGSHHTQAVYSGFSVHEIANDGVTIREYVSQNGVIFGIAWKGVIHPDLSTLLGSYSSEYQTVSKNSQYARARSALGRRNYSETKSANVVVEKSGHMRALQGKAYLPSLIPEGMTPSDIQ